MPDILDHENEGSATRKDAENSEQSAGTSVDNDLVADQQTSESPLLTKNIYIGVKPNVSPKRTVSKFQLFETREINCTYV